MKPVLFYPPLPCSQEPYQYSLVLHSKSLNAVVVTVSKPPWSQSLFSIRHPLSTTGFSACQLELIIAITGFCLGEFLQYKTTEVWKKTTTKPETGLMQRTRYRRVYNRFYKSQPTRIWRKEREGYASQQRNPDKMTRGNMFSSK